MPDLAIKKARIDSQAFAKIWRLLKKLNIFFFFFFLLGYLYPVCPLDFFFCPLASSNPRFPRIQLCSLS